jgi:FkbM family methyltransferase
MFSKLKSLLKKLPVPLTKNHRYDLLTKKIIQQHCNETSNCIDAGAHRGEVLDWFLKFAPRGKHYAFEPIPDLYEALQEKYSDKGCKVFRIALSDTRGLSSFNYVTSNPAYSGLKKRRYDRKKETDTSIPVHTDRLDNVIPPGFPVHFIKIDVEGGEMNVLKGATRILAAYHPLIVFEFGIGGSDIYGTKPEQLFSFLETFHYKIFLLRDFIRRQSPLDPDGFKNQFYNKINYYFVASSPEAYK